MKQDPTLFLGILRGEKPENDLTPDGAPVSAEFVGDNPSLLDLKSESRQVRLDSVFIPKLFDPLPCLLRRRGKNIDSIPLFEEFDLIFQTPVERKFLILENPHADETDVLVQKITFPAQKIKPPCDREKKHQTGDPGFSHEFPGKPAHYNDIQPPESMNAAP